MLKKIMLFSFFCIMNISGQDNWQTSPYFDTQFLQSYEKVKDSLIKDGFAEVSFLSLDGYLLKGLYRSHPDATSNVILAAGFFPGRKEGMASFVDLLPKECNILFIDARGHGDSSGPFWRTIMWYGQNEYKDIIGALHFLCEDNDLPNLLLGVCIGAFHCARASIYLETHNLTTAYHVQGLIFDSGFGSIAHLKWVPTTHINQKTLPHLCRSWIYTQDNRESIKERYLYKISSTITSGFTQLSTYIISPFLESADEETNLFNKIHMITIPMLYIHCKNDTYTPFEDVVTLANKSSNSSHWWIDHSEHACHHLKFKQEYRDWLLEFIHKTIHT